MQIPTSSDTAGGDARVGIGCRRVGCNNCRGSASEGLLASVELRRMAASICSKTKPLGNAEPRGRDAMQTKCASGVDMIGTPAETFDFKQSILQR